MVQRRHGQHRPTFAKLRVQQRNEKALRHGSRRLRNNSARNSRPSAPEAELLEVPGHRQVDGKVSGST